MPKRRLAAAVRHRGGIDGYFDVWVVHGIFIRYFEQNVQDPDENLYRLSRITFLKEHETSAYRRDRSNVTNSMGSLDQHLHPDRESATALSSGGKLRHQLTAVTTNSLVNICAD